MKRILILAALALFVINGNARAFTEEQRNVQGTLARTSLAAMALFMANNAKADVEFTKEQRNVLFTLGRVSLIIQDCPFEKNQDEFVLWAYRTNLTPAMMLSKHAMQLVTDISLDELTKKEKTGPDCDGWWTLYGIDGRHHTNLLLKR